MARVLWDRSRAMRCQISRGRWWMGAAVVVGFVVVAMVAVLADVVLEGTICRKLDDAFGASSTRNVSFCMADAFFVK